jgi:hypothetical protein
LQIRNSEALLDPAVGVAGTFRCPPVDGSVCFQGGGGARISATRSPEAPPGWSTGAAQYHTIRYVAQCAGFAAPGSDVCSASVDAAQQCAFGLGDFCKRCPYGAHCPGGYETRSFPGFYTLSSAEGIVEPCETPSEVRCAGWDMSGAKTTCGVGYAGECLILSY